MVAPTSRLRNSKKTISGIDQVFTINDVVNDSGGGVGAGGVGGIGAGGLSDYTWDFGDEALGNLDDINKKQGNEKNSSLMLHPVRLLVFF